MAEHAAARGLDHHLEHDVQVITRGGGQVEAIG